MTTVYNAMLTDNPLFMFAFPTLASGTHPVNDETGNGHSGSGVNIGNSLNLGVEGTNYCATVSAAASAYLAFPSLGAYNNQSYSVEFWVKDLVVDDKWIWNDYTIYNDGFAGLNYHGNSCRWLTVSGVKKLRFELQENSGGGTQTWDFAISTLGDGLWHQIATTYDYTNNVFKGYVDGAAVVTSTPGTHGSYLNISNVVFGLEGDVGIATYKLDDVGFWESVLTPTEIGTHWAAGPVANNLTVNAPVAGTITALGYAETITTVTITEIDPPIAGTVTAQGYAPSIAAGGSITLGVPAANITVGTFAPTITSLSVPTVVTLTGNVTARGIAPFVYVEDQSFTFIDESYVGFTAREGTAIPLIDLQALAHGESKVARFRIGNTQPYRTSFLVEAVSSNVDIPPMVSFSLDGQTYTPTITIQDVDANAVTNAVWMKFTTTAKAFISPGAFLIHVNQAAAV